jgi:hypothetical protein
MGCYPTENFVNSSDFRTRFCHGKRFWEKKSAKNKFGPPGTRPSEICVNGLARAHLPGPRGPLALPNSFRHFPTGSSREIRVKAFLCDLCVLPPSFIPVFTGLRRGKSARQAAVKNRSRGLRFSRLNLCDLCVLPPSPLRRDKLRLNGKASNPPVI